MNSVTSRAYFTVTRFSWVRKQWHLPVLSTCR